MKFFNCHYTNEGEETQDPDETDQICKYCDKNFKGLLDLGEHLAKEHRKPGTETECPACPRKFDNRYWMNLHIKSFHLNGKKKCTECNKFITLNNYANHMRFHRQKMSESYLNHMNALQ